MTLYLLRMLSYGSVHSTLSYIIKCKCDPGFVDLPRVSIGVSIMNYFAFSKVFLVLAIKRVHSMCIFLHVVCMLDVLHVYLC